VIVHVWTLLVRFIDLDAWYPHALQFVKHSGEYVADALASILDPKDRQKFISTHVLGWLNVSTISTDDAKFLAVSLVNTDQRLQVVLGLQDW
jgi:hypothetical protein